MTIRQRSSNTRPTLTEIGVEGTMSRRRQFWALLLASFLTAQIFSTPAPVFAVSYTYDCHNPINYDYQHYIQRHLTNYPTVYSAVIGDSDVRAVFPCTNLPASEGNVWTGDLPANLQGPNGIVQLGYIYCVAVAPETGCGSGITGAKVPGDNHPHFFYICDATSGGDICRADNWGTLTTPIVGHRYRFRIEHTGSSWKHTITDKGTGASGSKSIPDGGWSLGDEVWWGVEGYDFNSTLGPKASDSDLHMYWLQYLRTGVTGWQVAHPIAREHCELSLLSLTCTGAWPAHFTGSVYNQNFTDGDAVNFWTNAH